ncbi:MAG: TetR/AcrR family transcriptional regulator [Nitrospirae bacterium]|nr:TetR/AcrR family transcriptional regulator [Nitrospirota bacterium]
MRKKGQDSIKTREALLKAALELISRRGYLGATTKEIARKAGVTEITLFRHFGSKEQLFEQLLKEYSFLPKLRDLIPKVKRLSAEEALLGIGLAFLDTLKERERLVKIMLSEMNIYPDKVKVIYSRFISELIDVLGKYFSELQKKGVLIKFDALTGARAFLGMIFSYFLSEVILQGRMINSREQSRIVKTYVNIFLHGVVNRKGHG